MLTEWEMTRNNEHPNSAAWGKQNANREGNKNDGKYAFARTMPGSMIRGKDSK